MNTLKANFTFITLSSPHYSPVPNSGSLFATGVGKIWIFLKMGGGIITKCKWWFSCNLYRKMNKLYDFGQNIVKWGGVIINWIFLTLFPNGSGYPLFHMRGAYAPLSNIPENGRLAKTNNEDGLKLQKNPNQFHI